MMNSKALLMLLLTGVLTGCLGQYNVGSMHELGTLQPGDGGSDAGVTLDACAGLGEAACGAASACESRFYELCDCTCPGPESTHGNGCAECSASCFAFAACQVRVEQPGIDCGGSRCGAGEYCEIVTSDIPEFNGSYVRHQCVAAPRCDSNDACLCVQGASRCKYGTSFFNGTFERQGDACSLTCDIGG